MKKTATLFSMIVQLLFSTCLLAQSTNTNTTRTPAGLFDDLYDRFGTKYNINELKINSTIPIGGTSTVYATPTIVCSAGYFDLYFAPGTMFANNSAARNTLCQVCTDISNAIISPLSSLSNTVRINMYCSNTSTADPGALGAASGYYAMPMNPNIPNQGIIDNQIYKAITTGQDPYYNLTGSFNFNNSFYSGLILANPSPIGGAWSFNLGTTNIGAGYLDFYTVMLHEVTHALGFASLISQAGTSIFSPNSNYYSRFDRYLCDPNGNPLLTSSTQNTCPQSNLSFSAPLSIIAAATTGCIANSTNCSNAVRYISPTIPASSNLKVFTPNCYTAGSSLSHFEDMCPFPSTTNLGCATNSTPALNNDYYFVMSNAGGTGNCYVKRCWKEEEKLALCDMGYSIASSFGNNAVVAGSYISYSSGNCTGPNVWGINDGFSNNSFAYTATLPTNNAIFIPINTILSNDSQPNNLTFTCPQIVYGNSGISISIQSGNLVILNNNLVGGLVVVSYIPVAPGPIYGTPVYVYAYFISGGCNPPNTCNIVQNGDFENYQLCGAFNTSQPNLSCWEYFAGSPDYYNRSCFPPYQAGVNTGAVTPPIDCFSPSPNNGFVGFGDVGNGSETAKNVLSSPLVPGQTYQLSCRLLNATNFSMNSAAVLPMVFTFASAPSPAITNSFPYLPHPLGLNVLASFAVPTNSVWSQYTTNFVFNAPTAHNALMIGIDDQAMIAQGYWNNNIGRYGFIDAVSIIPINAAPTFSIPLAASCNNSITTFTNLAQYATVNGTFSGAGITAVNTASGTLYNFNSPPTLTAGVYPIGFTYTANGCVQTIYQNVSIGQQIKITAAATSVCANLGNPAVLSAVSNATVASVYQWQPLGITGPTASAAPTANTIYTVNGNFNGCTSSETVLVTVSNSCCAYAQGNNYTNPFLTTSIVGITNINSNLIIPSGSSPFISGSVRFAPNTKIIVKAGASLEVKNAHLFACNNDMWDGIEVEDGGKLMLTNETIDNLIEDAKIAVNLTSQTTSTLNTIFTADRTTFNKNHIGISLSDYYQMNSNDPFIVRGCVFTCRNLASNNYNWTQAGYNSLTAVNGFENLRYIVPNTANNLSAPYLLTNTLTVTNLKNPYSTETSKTGIYLNNVGNTVGGTGYGITIGRDASPTEFNLFDSQNIGIESYNSHLNSINNVFQNSIIGNNYTAYGIKAFNDYLGTIQSCKLNLTAPSNPSICYNKFYDCHYSVDAQNQGTVSISYARFSSSQSSTTVPSVVQRGVCGVNIISNRFENYKIDNNNFINLYVGLQTNCIPDLITTLNNIPYYGYLMGTYSVSLNLFSPVISSSITAPLGTNYMGYGVTMETPLYGPWVNVATSPNFFTIAPFNGIKIKYNDFYKVQRGIYVSSYNHGLHKIGIGSNNMLLEPDASPNATQFGINSSWNTNCAINTNSVVGFSPNLSSSVAAIYCCELITSGIQCNVVSNTSKGFEFASSGNRVTWANNNMNNHARGLQATNWGMGGFGYTGFSGGIGGDQGSPSMASDNYWGGNWNTTTNLQTYVDANSNVGQSKLFTRPINGFSINPLYCGYDIAAFPINTYANGVQFTPTTAIQNTVNCSTLSAFAVPPGSDPVAMVMDSLYYGDPTWEINRFMLFMNMANNPALFEDNDTLQYFYEANLDGAYGHIMNIESALISCNYSSAQSFINSFVPESNVQQNFKTFYKLYRNYRVNHVLTATESADLLQLALQCPYSDGPAIYKARALHHLITKSPQRYNDDDCTPDGFSSRVAHNPEAEVELINTLATKERENPFLQKTEYTIYPNPAVDELNIKGAKQGELIKVSVKDVSGRLLLQRTLTIKGDTNSFKLDLKNGIYFVTLLNSKKQSVTKKIIISK